MSAEETSPFRGEALADFEGRALADFEGRAVGADAASQAIPHGHQNVVQPPSLVVDDEMSPAPSPLAIPRPCAAPAWSRNLGVYDDTRDELAEPDSAAASRQGDRSEQDGRAEPDSAAASRQGTRPAPQEDAVALLVRKVVGDWVDRRNFRHSVTLEDTGDSCW